MKFFKWLPALVILTIPKPIISQTINQPGEVKSISYRSGHDGSPVPDVRLSVLNEVRSNSEGQFLIPVRVTSNKTFCFTGINKTGYILISPDPEEMNSTDFAINPKAKVRIVMASKEELYKERKRIEKNIRQSHESEIAVKDSTIKALEKKIADLSARKEDVTLLEAECRKLKQELDAFKEAYYDSDDEIARAADELSRVDYKNLDSVSAKIMDLKKAGKGLEAADLASSQISSQMWESLHKDPSSIKRNVEKQRREYISAREEMKRTRLMLYNMYEGYRISFNNDEAAKYLRMYADMNPDDIYARLEYAEFIWDRLDRFEESAKIIRTVLPALENDSSGLRIKAMRLLACVLVDQGKGEESISLAKKALTLIGGSSQNDLAGRIWHDLSTAYTEFGKTDSAIFSVNKALEIRKKMCDSLECASSLVSYSALLIQTDSLEKAKRVLSEALSLADGHDDGYGTLASLYLHIGRYYAKMSDYQSALDSYSKALDIAETAFGTTHSTTSVIYGSVANVYKNVGMYDTALKYSKRAFAIDSTIYSPGHRKTILSALQIAQIKVYKGDFENAKNDFLRLLDLAEKNLGEKDKVYSTLLHDFASCLSGAGELEAAEKYYRKAIEIYEEICDSKSFLANYYNSFGTYCTERKDYETALEYFEKAEKIYLQVLTPDHLEFSKIYHNISYVYGESGENDKCEEYAAKAIEIAKRNGTSPRLTATYLSVLARHYRTIGQYNLALDNYSMAIELLSGIQAPKDLAKAWSNKGRTYEATNKLVEAIECFKSAVDIYTRPGIKDDDNAAYNQLYIAESYFRLEKMDSAILHAGKGAELFIKVYGDDSKGANVCRDIIRNSENITKPHVFALTVTEGGNMANKGFKGEYIVTNFNQYSWLSGDNLIVEAMNLPKDEARSLTLMDGSGRILSYRQDSGTLGIVWSVKEVSKKEHKKIYNKMIEYERQQERQR